jgi:hypothetical protein
MPRLPKPSGIAESISERLTRAVLIKAGLAEDDADKFMGRLTADVLAGKTSQQGKHEAIERQLAQLAQLQAAAKPKLSRDLTVAIAGAAIWDMMKSFFTGGPEPPPDKPKIESEPGDIIMVDWAGARISWDIKNAEKSFERGQWCRRQSHGTIDPKLAVYLDAEAMCLDARGQHTRAERLRRDALTIARGVYGYWHESVAAAHVNLGVCLFQCGKIDESDRHLAQGFRMMLDCVGQQHISMAGTVWNCYHCWKSRIPLDLVPQQFLQGVPEFEKLAPQMMALKYAITLLLALIDILRLAASITPAAPSPKRALVLPHKRNPRRKR